jgi:hypothetical protein
MEWGKRVNIKVKITVNYEKGKITKNSTDLYDIVLSPDSIVKNIDIKIKMNQGEIK